MIQIDSSKLVWYNPELESYQAGSSSDYDQLIQGSSQKEDFSVLCTFSATSEKMVGQLIAESNDELN